MERLPEWHHLSGHNRQGTIPAVYFCRLFSHLAKEGICASCYSFLVPCACPPLWLWHKAKWIRNGPAASPAQYTAWTWETNLAMPTRLLSSTAPPRRGKLRALKRKRGWAPNLMTRRETRCDSMVFSSTPWRTATRFSSATRAPRQRRRDRRNQSATHGPFPMEPVSSRASRGRAPAREKATRTAPLHSNARVTTPSLSRAQEFTSAVPQVRLRFLHANPG